jgi:fatty-acyl-CoA synthase
VLGVDLVRRGARLHRSRIAITCGDASLTFSQTDEISSRLANALIAQGMAPQDCVGVLLNNGLYSIPLDFACLKARVTRVPLNSRLSVAEHARMLQATEARVLIYGPGLAERAVQLRAALDGELITLSIGPTEAGDPDLLALMEKAAASDPMLPTPLDDVVAAIFTSGTTGTLKAAQHTQATWGAICTNILANGCDPRPDDAMLHAASLIHASGVFVMPFWIRGARSAVLGGFDPNSYLDQVVATGATHINIVPTMLGMVLGDGKRAAGDRGRLRSVIYGASPMPRPMIEAGLALWGPIFTQYYGQTEAPLMIAVLDAERHVGPDAPLGACGQPAVDVDVRLVDEAGHEVAAGEIGEVAVRGPIVHAGYRNAPELNAQVRLGGGFMRTRDLGRFDERGFLHLVDRTSDMIVTGGYNVYPREVEDALLAHPAIAECAVVAAPDDKWVEAVAAFVVLRPDAGVSDAQLQDFVRARLAGYKVPKRIERCATLPKSAVGKILRRALRDPLWGRGR